MSLPDTVFIFVLALIIFGPKKLPEIGRQLGKLVGEFRRASNEFKFQIEEELRQAELTDRQTIALPSKELESSSSTSSSAVPPTDTADSTSPDLPYPEETLPVGQYPNIDTLDAYELNAQKRKLAGPEAADGIQHDEVAANDTTASPSITPAVGAEPRTAPPYATSDASAITPAATAPSDLGENPGPPAAPADANAGATANPSPPPNHEPAGPYAAPAVADVTHG
ncbi:MAG: Sec-independent protein translocase subunit TatA/TatB [Acidobacteriaceae bacterium]